MKIIKLVLFTSSLIATTLVFADAPVIDAYQNDNGNNSVSTNTNQSTSSNTASSPATASLTMEQRIVVLERQINAANQQLSQLTDLQQQLQTLRGKLDVQTHSLQLLQEQVRTQYQDIDQRLNQKSLNTASTAINTKNNAKTLTGKTDKVSDSSISTDTDDSQVSSPTSQSNIGAVKKTASTKKLSETANASNNQDEATDKNSNEEQTAYQSAFELLKKKNYAKATIAFQAFIKKYPDSQNLVNARYWLGQLYLLQGQPDRSMEQFQTIIKKYPDDKKVPDAMLQLGLAYYAKSDQKQAISYLKKVQEKYPDSTAAKFAKTRLQQIQAASSANT